MGYIWISSLFVLAVLNRSLCQHIISKNYIQLPGKTSEACHDRSLCRYAACFSNSFLIEPRMCVFVASSCHCPDFKVCMPTKVILPRPGYYKHEYACQNPIDFLFRLQNTKSPATEQKANFN